MAKHKKRSDLTECTLYVDGMHCASCELLIEKKLLKHKGIESVDASLATGETTINFENGNRPNINNLNREFKEIGYRFSSKPFAKAREIPILNINENGQLQFNSKKLKSLFGNLTILLILIYGFKLMEQSQFGGLFSAQTDASFGGFFLLGLLAGTSSCAALVGGLLLSMTKQWNEVYIDSTSFIQKLKPHLMFHIGRLVSFALVGGIIGLLSSYLSDSFFADNSKVFSFITIATSLIMLAMAFQMYGVKWAQCFAIKFPKTITGFAANEENFKGKLMPLIVGFLTFLLPCAVTISAFTIVLTSGSAFQGMLMMLAFAIGTFIPLIIISMTGIKLNSKPHLTAKFNKIGALLIMFFAIYNINGQLNIFGLPSLSDIDLISTKPTKQIAYAVTDNDGNQLINVTASGFSYIANGSTTLKAGVPTKLAVNNLGITGCGQYMQATGLFPGYVQLKKGQNLVEFTPKAGSYKLTCSMGMVPPITITVI